MKLFLLIAAIIAAIFGLGFLLLPVFTLNFYAVDLSQDIHAQFLTRYGGSAILGWAVAWFLARGAKTYEDLKKAGLLGGLVVGITGLVVALMNAWLALPMRSSGSIL